MMKRKLTLGLVVFCVGILMTACGTKKSTSTNTATTATDTTTTTTLNPINNSATCMASGTCNTSANYTVTNPTLYGQALGYTASTTGSGSISPIYSNNSWNVSNFFSSLLGNTANCAVQVGLARLFVQLGASGASVDCAVGYGSTTTSTSQTSDGYPTGSYPAEIQSNYVNSQFTSLAVTIRNGRYNGNGDTIEFYPSNDGSNVMYNNSRNIRLDLGSTELIMSSPQGELGRIRQ